MKPSNDPEVVSDLFLDIINDLKTPRELLETMLQTGLLTKYIPELEATVCRTQFDTYHVYTVDIHLLLTLVELKKIGQGFYLKEEPLLYGIWGEIEDFLGPLPGRSCFMIWVKVRGKIMPSKGP